MPEGDNFWENRTRGGAIFFDALLCASFLYLATLLVIHCLKLRKMQTTRPMAKAARVLHVTTCLSIFCAQVFFIALLASSRAIGMIKCGGMMQFQVGTKKAFFLYIVSFLIPFFPHHAGDSILFLQGFGEHCVDCAGIRYFWEHSHGLLQVDGTSVVCSMRFPSDFLHLPHGFDSNG